MARDNDHVSYLSDLADQHQDRLSRALVDVEDRIAELMTGAPLSDGNLFDLEWAVNTRTELRQIIDKQYLSKVDGIIRDYKGVADDATAMLKTYGDFTELDRSVISQLQKLTFQGFDDIGNEYLDVIAKQVYESTLTGQSFAQTVNNLRQTVGNDMKRYATQQVHDSLMQFDANVNVAIGNEAGVERWKYVGANDSATRGHCAKHVGKTYTKEEILEIWQGEWSGKANGNPFIVRGGFNCRHQWRPVFDEEVVSQVEEKVKKEPEFVPRKTVPKLKTKEAAISSVSRKLAKSTKKPDSFRDRPFDQYHVDFEGNHHIRFRPYGAKKGDSEARVRKLFDEQVGTVIEGSLSPETLTLIDDALDMTADLAVKFKVPNIRTVVPVKNRKATMSMGDGRLSVSPTYWNPRAKTAFQGNEAATKKIAKKQAERTALLKDRDALSDKYYDAISKQDWETSIPIDVQIDGINNKLGKLDKEIIKLEDSLAKPANTWKVGDDLNKRPHSAKQYFDTPEEQFANTVRHEFGHLVHQEHNRTGSEGGFFNEESPIEKYLTSLFYQYGKRGNKKVETWVYPTKYSEYNHKEWWAESFSLYNGGRKDLVEPKLVKLMDHMIEKEGRLTTFDGWDFVKGKMV